MIRRCVSAVFLLRDGFSGRPLASGAQVRCTLDGVPVRPLWKDGGYLVFTDLPPGEHTLTVQRPFYRLEQRSFPVRPGEMWEDTVHLKPGTGYPFPAESAALELTVTEGRNPSAWPVWLGMSGPAALKLAQDDGEGTAIRLFCRNAALLPVPGYFLIPEKSGGELIHLRSLLGESGELETPLEHRHPRGSELIPMQRYDPDGAGRLSARFPQAGTLWLCCQGAVRSLELVPGLQTWNWNWKERI